MNQNCSLRILVIDDSPQIHTDFIKILTTESSQTTELDKYSQNIFEEAKSEKVTLPFFEIDTASQGREGVKKIEKSLQEKQPYALAFVDIRMPPGWDGIETIKHIWEIDPSIQIVICTAYSDYSWEETIEELGQKENLLILKKPFDAISVRQLSVALTKKWQLLQEVYQYTHILEKLVEERTSSLKQSLSISRGTLESSTDGILVVDNTNNILDYNNTLIKMWKVPRSIIEEKNPTFLMDHISSQLKEAEQFIKSIQDLNSNTDTVKLEKLACKDGHIFEYYTQSYSLDDKIAGRIWSFRDITQRAVFEEKIQFQATHDALTSLPNRVVLFDQFKSSANEANRSDTMLGVFFLDLDRFKLINDSLSHEAGDKVLIHTSKRIQSITRSEDTIVRFGGDEFVILIGGVKHEKYFIDFGNKILSIFEAPFTLGDQELFLSASIGISIYPKDGKNIHELLRNADSAMYQAKGHGANQFKFYTSELNKKNVDRLEKEMDLNRALKNNELFLCYQPQLDLETGEIVSFEALIRWLHPDKGVISPAEFIPLAEETSLIVPIGEWVLRTACKQNKEWQTQGLPPVRIAVNVTTKQFKLCHLPEVVKKILDETGLDPHWLDLELTENMISDADVVEAVLELREIGVQFSLDDFGSGNSAFNYLREIPVDRIKIDKSYVDNFESKRGDDVIIQAIITMAKGLHLEVLAEGVETRKQLDFLKKEKCNEIQGYYFSKPLLPGDCEKILKDNKGTG